MFSPNVRKTSISFRAVQLKRCTMLQPPLRELQETGPQVTLEVAFHRFSFSLLPRRHRLSQMYHFYQVSCVPLEIKNLSSGEKKKIYRFSIELTSAFITGDAIG